MPLLQLGEMLRLIVIPIGIPMEVYYQIARSHRRTTVRSARDPVMGRVLN